MIKIILMVLSMGQPHVVAEAYDLKTCELMAYQLTTHPENVEKFYCKVLYQV